jgi:hypothetical protein
MKFPKAGYALYWLALTLIVIVSTVAAVLQYPIYLKLIQEGL